MKKFMVLILVVCVLALSSCSASVSISNPLDAKESTSAKSITTSVSEPILEETIAIAAPEETTPGDMYAAFESKLTELEIDYEKITCAFMMVGGDSGYTYSPVDGGEINLIHFDVNGQNYKDIEQSQSINDGQDPVIAKDGYILFVSDDTSKKTDIQSAFSDALN